MRSIYYIMRLCTDHESVYKRFGGSQSHDRSMDSAVGVRYCSLACSTDETQ